jgi:hypothetical protein
MSPLVNINYLKTAKDRRQLFHKYWQEKPALQQLSEHSALVQPASTMPNEINEQTPLRTDDINQSPTTSPPQLTPAINDSSVRTTVQPQTDRTTDAPITHDIIPPFNAESFTRTSTTNPTDPQSTSTADPAHQRYDDIYSDARPAIVPHAYQSTTNPTQLLNHRRKDELYDDPRNDSRAAASDSRNVWNTQSNQHIHIHDSARDDTSQPHASSDHRARPDDHDSISDNHGTNHKEVNPTFNRSSLHEPTPQSQPMTDCDSLKDDDVVAIVRRQRKNRAWQYLVQLRRGNRLWLTSDKIPFPILMEYNTIRARKRQQAAKNQRSLFGQI